MDKPNGQYRELNGTFSIGWKSSSVAFLENIGNPSKWKTPDEMYESFVSYLEWIENNNLISHEVYGKDATLCKVPKMRAITIFGFARHAGTSAQIFYDYEQKTPFKQITSYIRTYCTGTNIEGAMAGIFNAQLTSRLEGLVDKKQVETNNVSVHFYQPIQAPSAGFIEEGDEDLLIDDAEVTE